MTQQEYLEFMRKRYHTYAYLKFSLKDCTKEKFEEKSQELLDEIFEDEKMYFDFSKEFTLVAPVQREYENLSGYSQRVM
jgi:disulfide oxidoreductase YuzD